VKYPCTDDFSRLKHLEIMFKVDVFSQKTPRIPHVILVIPKESMYGIHGVWIPSE